MSWLGPANRAYNNFTVPGAPTIGTATAGNGQASVAFTPPASTGGTPITSYTATSSPGGITATGTVSPIVVTGLTNGTAYTFTVHATNAIGSGPESAASNAVTPTSGTNVPVAPTNVQAWTTPNPTTAYVTWASANGNGSPVTSYVVTCSDNTISPVTVTAYTGTSVVAIPNRANFSGLTGGSPVTFTVQAVNANGTSAASSASNSVTPSAFVDSFFGANFDPIACGGSLIGGPDTTSSYRWSNAYSDGALYRSVNPGDATLSNSFVPATTAPAYPSGSGMTNQKLYEITPSGGGGYAMQLYIQHDNPNTSNNGGYIERHYNYLVFQLYPYAAGTYQHPKPEFTFSYPDIITSYANPNINFQYGNYPVNGFVTNSTGLFDMTTGPSTGWTTNTATSFNVGNNNWNAGDRFYASIGDQEGGNQILDLSKFVTAPTNGVLTVGQWNTVKIPLDNTVVNGANGFNIRGISADTIYKIHVLCPNNPGVQWFCNVGFSQ